MEVVLDVHVCFGWKALVIGIVVDERIINAFWEGRRVMAFTMHMEFCGTKGE